MAADIQKIQNTHHPFWLCLQPCKLPFNCWSHQINKNRHEADEAKCVCVCISFFSSCLTNILYFHTGKRAPGLKETFVCLCKCANSFRQTGCVCAHVCGPSSTHAHFMSSQPDKVTLSSYFTDKTCGQELCVCVCVKRAIKIGDTEIFFLLYEWLSILIYCMSA